MSCRSREHMFHAVRVGRKTGAPGSDLDGNWCFQRVLLLQNQFVRSRVGLAELDQSGSAPLKLAPPQNPVPETNKHEQPPLWTLGEPQRAPNRADHQTFPRFGPSIGHTILQDGVMPFCFVAGPPEAERHRPFSACFRGRSVCVGETRPNVQGEPGQSLDLEEALSRWTSVRMQTLWRTVEGVCSAYARALATVVRGRASVAVWARGLSALDSIARHRELER